MFATKRVRESQVKMRKSEKSSLGTILSQFINISILVVGPKSSSIFVFDQIVNKILKFFLRLSDTARNFFLELRIVVPPLLSSINICGTLVVGVRKHRYHGNQDRLHSVDRQPSTFAGLSSLGSASIDITEIKIVSTVWIGSHLSLAFSYPYLSSPSS